MRKVICKGCWLLLVLLMPLFVGCRGKGQWVEETVVGNYKGEARYNPYLAAQKFLETYDIESETSFVLPRDLYQYGTVVVPASALTTSTVANNLIEFAEDGGVVLVVMAGGENTYNDFTPWVGRFDDEAPPIGFETLLEEFHLTTGVGDFEEIDYFADKEEKTGAKRTVGDEAHLRRNYRVEDAALKTSVGKSTFAIEQEGSHGLRFSNQGKEERRQAAAEDHILQGETADIPMQFYYLQTRKGLIAFLAHARPLRNPYLDRLDHAQFLVYLTAAEGAGDDVLFVIGSGESFGSLLWKAGWPTVVAALILLALWLWWKLPRFGPVGPVAEHDARDPVAEYTALGRFFWRTRTISTLLNPLRKNLPEEPPTSVEVSPTAYQNAREAKPITDPEQLLTTTRLLKALNEHKK